MHLANKFGLRPSRGYGQNFLIDEEVITKIIAEAAELNTNLIVEVGPGFGVLTEKLAGITKRVVSFEIEKKLEPYWEEKNKQLPNLEIKWGNVLKTFEDFIKNIHEPYSVVANLPYQITSPVIRMFLECTHPPTDLVLMVQKEVAERICAEPGDMSVLAIATQYYANCEYLFTVPRTSFWPSPRVDSAVIHLRRHEKLALSTAEEKRLFVLAKQGFSSKRKKLSSNLLPAIGKNNRTKLSDVFEDLGLGEMARAQELSLADWMELAKIFVD